MPRANTIATELAVAVGLLGIGPLDLTREAIKSAFMSTLSPSNYDVFVREYQRDESKYGKLFNLGSELARHYAPFATQKLKYVSWQGPQQQAATSSASMDLFVANTFIGVKDDSDVALNSSPENLFVNYPSAMEKAKQAPNWYVKIAFDEYRELYSIAKHIWGPELPYEVLDHDRRSRSSSGWNRKTLGKRIKEQPHPQFTAAYI